MEEGIISKEKDIVPAPNAVGGYCVGEAGSDAVFVSKRGSEFHCTCQTFKEKVLCQHVLAVSDHLGQLESTVTKYHAKPALNVSALVRRDAPKSRGQKPNQKAPRKRGRDVQPVAIHHYLLVTLNHSD